MRATRTVVALLTASLCPACAPFGTNDAQVLDAGGADAGADAGSTTGISWRGTASAFAPNPPTDFMLTIPGIANAVAGDVLVAAIALGDNSVMAANLPVITPPPGWIVLTSVPRANSTLAIVYFKTFSGAAESTYTWTVDRAVTGLGWVSAYSGVDGRNPIAGVVGLVRGQGVSFDAPDLGTTMPGAILIAGFFGKAPGGGPTPQWTLPPSMNARVSMDNGGTRSGGCADVALPLTGPTSPRTATSTLALDYAIVVSVGLRPASGS